MKQFKDELAECFKIAKEEGFKYIGVSFQIKNFPEKEVIINSRDNFDSKMKYYLDTYDEKLYHKFSGDKVKIVDFTCGDTYEDIEMYFNDKYNLPQSSKFQLNWHDEESVKVINEIIEDLKTKQNKHISK